MLLTVDEVAALYGRATATAMEAHFTGDVRYFSQSMNEINQLDMFKVQEFARAHITRDQMVTVIVEPMDEEERARMEAAARAAAAPSTRSRSAASAFRRRRQTPRGPAASPPAATTKPGESARARTIA